MARRQLSEYLRRDLGASGESETDDGATHELYARNVSNVQANAGRKIALIVDASARSRPGPSRRLDETEARSAAVPALFDPAHLLQLPRATEKKRGWTMVLFATTFVIPVSLVAIYYMFIASDIYQTQFRFSVRNSSPSQTSSAMSSTLSLAGIPSNNDAINYQVVDYLTSRAVIDQLQPSLKLLDTYSRPSIDWIARYGGSTSLERFERYWKGMVTAQYDQVGGIVSVSVDAFSAQDSYRVATALIKAAEDLVNDVEQRSLNSAVESARTEMIAAQDRLEQAHFKLTSFRKSSGVIDPDSSFVASNSALVQTLQGSLASLQTTYSMLAKQRLDPTGPLIVGLNNQIAATKEQLRTIGTSVANAANARSQKRSGGATLDNEALSTVIAQYEQLNLDYQFAQTLVTNALAAFEQARMSAFTQHYYVTPYVRPSLATSPQLPDRLFCISMTAGICLVIWFLSYASVIASKERLGDGVL